MIRVVVAVALVLFSAVTAMAQSTVGPRKIVVITDLEPDDRIAFEVLKAHFKPEEIALVGTSVLHTKRKAILVRRLLDQLGFNSVPVFQGWERSAMEYAPVAGSRAALEYKEEGAGIISSDDVKNAKSTSLLHLGDRALIQGLGDFLELNRLAGYKNNVEIVLLAPPTDLYEAITNRSLSMGSIRAVHMMGGWTEALDDSGSVVRRSTYNWNMGHQAAQMFMLEARKLFPFKTILYSSHTIKPTFGGGSINASNFPKLIEGLNTGASKSPSLVDFMKAGATWDAHLIQKIPPLGKIIGPFAGKQFTPADPLVMIGLSNPSLIKKSKTVDVMIDTSDLDDTKGFNVILKDAPGKIELVEEIDRNIFESEMLKALNRCEDILK